MVSKGFLVGIAICVITLPFIIGTMEDGAKNLDWTKGIQFADVYDKFFAKMFLELIPFGFGLWLVLREVETNANKA